MGKLKGFIEYERAEEGHIPVRKRLKNFKEFAESIESEKHHPIKESFNQSADKFHKE